MVELWSYQVLTVPSTVSYEFSSLVVMYESQAVLTSARDVTVVPFKLPHEPESFTIRELELNTTFDPVKSDGDIV